MKRNELMSEANDWCAEVFINPDDDSIRVEAPKGCRWNWGDVHELCDILPHTKKGKSDVYEDLVRRMNEGVSECGADCEYWDDES